MSPSARRRGRAAAVAVVLLATAGCTASAAVPDAAPSTTGTTSTSTTASTASTTSTTASTTTTTTASTTTSSTTTTPAQAGAPGGLTVETGDLQPGSVGLRTFALQKALKSLRYDPGEPDGKFGLKTTTAVWAYQALAGMRQDGVVNVLLEASILAAKPQPMLRPDLGPTHTEIDLDRQVLLVFRDNALQLVTHVSSGTGLRYCNKGTCGIAVTPVGDYRYQRRITGWRVAPLGRLYNPVYFNGGIAVHGAASVPATPASHGCVRIPMHIAEYFPGLVANGDAISVFRGGTGPATAPVAKPATDPNQPGDVLAGD